MRDLGRRRERGAEKRSFRSPLRNAAISAFITFLVKIPTGNTMGEKKAGE